MLNTEEWPNDWGILFAAYVSDRIYGKVRLNKFLSLLQREGFPIKNKFIIEEMGPYDKNIAKQAEKLSERGLISIKEKDINQDSPLFIYEITENGKNYTQENIFPLLNKMPDKIAFKCSFISVRDFILFTKLNKIVSDIHNQLILDDSEQFLAELRTTQNKIDYEFNNLQKESIDFCHINLDFLGFFEFTSESLQKINTELSDNPFVGKNHVLYNAKKLIERFEIVKDTFNAKIKLCRKEGCCLEYPCPIYDKLLNHRFRCIEFNSDLYEIKEAIDYRKTNFEVYFKENNFSEISEQLDAPNQDSSDKYEHSMPIGHYNI
jgi:hypothetical protein